MRPMAETSAKEGAAGRLLKSASRSLRRRTKQARPLRPDGNVLHRDAVRIEILRDIANDIRVVRARKAGVAGDDDRQGPVLGLGRWGQQGCRLCLPGCAGNMRQDLPGLACVGPRSGHRLHGLSHLGCADSFKCPRDLRDVLTAGRSNSAAFPSRGHAVTLVQVSRNVCKACFKRSPLSVA